MRIYLTQHGLAIPKDLDPERPLNEQGRRDVQRLSILLKHAGVRIEQILHSGKLRAEQTASAIAGVLGLAGTARPANGLSPNDAVEPFAAQIGNWTADTLVVGHLPFLGRLASLLLAGDPERPMLAFQPGGTACLERDPDGRWTLLWMVRPDLLAPHSA